MLKPLAIVGLLLLVATTGRAQSPTWSLVEDLRIGSLDGEVALSFVVDLTRSPDGRTLYVWQRGVNSLWTFDATSGRRTGQVGRGGEGPGEFSNIIGIGWKSDTLFVADQALRRIVLFTAGGEHLRTEQVDYPRLPEWRSIHPIAYTSAGTLARTTVDARSRRDQDNVYNPVLLFDMENRLVRTIGQTSHVNGFAPVGPMNETYFPQPLALREIYGLDLLGSTIVAVRQPAGRDPPGRFEVVRSRFDGQIVYSRSYTYVPRPLPQAWSDSVRARHAEGWARSGMTSLAAARAIAAEYVVIPTHYPPFTSELGLLPVLPDGSVWLRQEDVGGPSVRWIYLDPEGLIRANILAPARLRILTGDEDVLWGTITGDFDESYIVRYRIQR